jgi:hypothetical protein
VMKLKNNNQNDIQFDKEIEQFLEAYTIEYPTEEEITKSISIIKTYTPEKKKSVLSIYKSLRPLLKRSSQDIANIHVWFWVANLALFLIGVGSIIFIKQNPYYLIMYLAPIPFLLGLIEAFKSKDENVLELEMSCKYSGQEVILSKLFLIGMYNILLNTAASVALYNLVPYLYVTKLLLYWMTPFTFVMAMALMMAKKFRSGWLTSGFISVWSVACIVILQLTNMYTSLEMVNPLIYIGIITISIIVAIYEMKKLYSDISLVSLNE